MTRQLSHNFFLAIVVMAGLLAFGPAGSAAAATIQGQVMNGTTSRLAARQKLQLLLPRGGMQVVAETTTDAEGHFALSGGEIDPAGFYLLQATYGGVDYSAPVKFDSSGNATTAITIYDSTSRAPALSIRSARILVRVAGDKASVQELFAVNNPSEPPRTYVSPAGTFRFHLASSSSQPSAAVAGLLNMPLPQTPVPGKSAGDYSIDYGLKPGLTVVMVAYDAVYSSGAVALADSVDLPVEHLEFFVNPPSLEVSSPILKPTGQDSETGSATYAADNLAARTKLEAGLSGAAAPASRNGNENTQGEPQVKVVRDPVSKVGVPLLLCFLLVLLWALGIRLAKDWPRWKAGLSTSPVQKQFRAKFEGVTRSIAGLDELFAAGKIPEKQYWKERLELKAKAVAILKKGPAANSESYAARNTSR